MAYVLSAIQLAGDGLLNTVDADDDGDKILDRLDK